MWRGLGLGLLLGAALGGVAWAQAPTRFDGQYTGELRLTQIIGGDCTQPPLGAVYPLTIVAGEVSFAYLPRFATTLTGRVDRNGALKASARTRSGVVQMTGRVVGNSITASIRSPSCTYTYQAGP